MAFSRSRGDVGQAFRSNTQLQQFVLTDVTPTGRILGTGSFGSVEEVMYKRLVCAGKRMHELLFQAENQGVPEMIQKYQQECQLMSSLCHPNVTQFLGVCFLPGTQLPLLVMERLETSLDNLLEHMPNIPLSLKCSILENVASGLLYLHERNPPVIHRDLTSRNVLLTSSLAAKITDMGNSRIIRPGQVVRTLSALPGTLVYMPPEAQDDTHRYGPSLDIFSFGHLALFTVIQTFPGELLPSTFPNPDNIREVRGRTELERRGKYIEMLEAEFGRLHLPLVQLVKECLHNVPNERPTTDDLLARLQRMREEVGCGGGPMNLDIMVRVRLAKEVKVKDRRIEELSQQQETHEAEMENKTRELEDMMRELEVKIVDIQRLQGDIEIKNRNLAQRDQAIASKDQAIAGERGRVQQLLSMMQINNELMARKDRDIQQLQDEMQVQRTNKDRQIAEQTGRVQQLQEELHLRETQLREELQSQEAEISRLREELSKCQKSKGSPHKQVPLKLPLQLKWRRGPDMPFGTSNYVQSVQVQGTLYVGGGGAVDAYNECTVMTYDINAGTWATLPPYKLRSFAITVIEDHLVLVGGKEHTGDYSKVLGTWNEDSKKWTHPYPDMTTGRYLCSAVTYKQYLVVAGGTDASGSLLPVEVMNTDIKQWYAGPPTPIAWSSMKTAIVGDTCYFMGGGIEGFYTNKVYSVSLPALVSQLNSDSSTKDRQTWKELPQLPGYFGASPLSISGSLLAFGKGKNASALHLYQPDAGQWVKVTDLSSPRYLCTCKMITDKELLVAGGETDKSAGRLRSVELAEIIS